MSDLLAARSQMAMSLAFHIIFAVIGVSFPLMMSIAELCWLRTRDPIYRLLARRWAKGAAILFAVGAVSGTVLSFELGLLWPRFMEKAGSVIGMPFSMEGFAFFTEAIFLGIYLFGWEKVPDWLHWASGVIVAISGLTSAIFVTDVNAWMNTPTGFDISGSRFIHIDLWKAMLNPAAIPEAIHMVLAAYCAVGFATAGIHSWLLLRGGGSRFNRIAITIALAIGGTAVLAQALSGDALARMVARTQPVKLASLEGQFDTEAGAPLRIGGVPSVERRQTRFAIEIPHGLSLLAFHNPDAVVKGLDEFPPEDWPPVLLVHISFQTMVGLGSVLCLVTVLGGFLAFKKTPLTDRRWYLILLVFCAPLGMIALEAGWMVTELGRQPWVIDQIMRTRDAVTTTPHLEIPFLIISLLYAILGIIVVWLLSAHVIAAPSALELSAEREK